MEKSVVLPKSRLSRREFDKLAGAIGIVGAVLLHGRDLMSVAEIYKYFATLQTVSELKNKPIDWQSSGLPPTLWGFFPNMVFTYLDEDNDERRNLINDVVDLGAKRARVITGDDPEKELGKYNFSALQQLADFAKELKSLDMGLEIDLFDFYTLGNGLLANDVYGALPIATSPYNLTGTIDGYRQFFVDSDLRSKFRERVKHIISYLREKGVDNIYAWSVNEPLPELIGRDGKQILTQWYSDIVPLIKTLDAETPIVAGVKYPWHIDFGEIKELTANSINAYSYPDLYFLKKYMKNHNEPLIMREYGIPHSKKDKNGNYKQTNLRKYSFESWLFNKLIIDLSFKRSKSILTPRIGSWGGWKFANYQDGRDMKLGYISDDQRSLIKALASS